MALEFRPRLPSKATIAKQIIEQYETEFDFFMYVGDVTSDLADSLPDLVTLNVSLATHLNKFYFSSDPPF
jgi:trehalose-6-phosphatase